MMVIQDYNQDRGELFRGVELRHLRKNSTSTIIKGGGK